MSSKKRLQMQKAGIKNKTTETGREINVITSPGAALSEADAIAAKATIEGYNLGIEVSQIYQRRIVLYALIEYITYALLSTEGLPAAWQGIQLQNTFKERAKRPTIHKQLQDACAALINATDDLAHRYPSFPTERYADSEGDARIIALANEYAGGIRRLITNDPPSEQPSALELREILLKHGSEQILQMIDDIRANAPQRGRQTGIDEVTRAIGQHALDLSEKLHSRKWKLIGERHYADLINCANPSKLDLKVIKRYQQDGYPASNGEWQWHPKLSDTVSNAVSAVERFKQAGGK